MHNLYSLTTPRLRETLLVLPHFWRAARSSKNVGWRRLVSLNIVLSKLGRKYEIQSHLAWAYYTVRRQKSSSKLICLTKFLSSVCPYSYYICNFRDMEMQYIMFILSSRLRIMKPKGHTMSY